MTESTPAPAPRRIGVREFRGNISEYLRQARRGASFLVTSRGEVVAEIRPPSSAERPKREPGGLKGKIWMAPDFDEWPDDILDAFEGRDE